MYLSYKKIVSQRSVPYSGGKRLPNLRTRTLMCFEKPDGIIFVVNTFYAKSIGKKPDRKSFKLKFRKKKNGELSCNFYDLNRMRICRPLDMESLFVRREKCEPETRLTWEGTRFQKNSKKVNGLSKSASISLYRYIKKICRKNDIQTKWFSKDPFCLIQQICYPGSMNFDDKFLRQAKLNSFFKKEPTRSIGTNGTLTRNALYSLLKEKPQFADAICEFAKFIRIKFGVDKMREFLNKKKPPYSLYAARGIKKYFSHCSFDQLMKFLDEPFWILQDTLRMLSRGAEIVPFDTLTGLHDELAITTRRKADLKLRESIVPKHDCIELLTKLWDSEYYLVLPYNGEDLINWSTLMRNCVASYVDLIAQGSYYIAAIYKDGSLLYNIGFTVKDDNFYFNQWSGRGNSMIPEDVQQILASQFSKIENFKNLPCQSMQLSYV